MRHQSYHSQHKNDEITNRFALNRKFQKQKKKLLCQRVVCDDVKLKGIFRVSK